MSAEGTEPRGEPAADAFTLLSGLARTVKEELAPRAAVPFVRDQLYSLSSILRILAAKGPGLAEDAREDERGLWEALERLAALGVIDSVPSGASTTELRQLLATATRDLRADAGEGHDAVRAFLRDDLTRPHVALLDPAPAERAVGEQIEGAQAADRDTARRGLLEDVRERMRDRRGDAGLEVELAEEQSAGYSAETRTVRLTRSEQAGNGADDLALRVQWPDLPMAQLQQTVQWQAAAMRAAEAEGIAVPSVEVAVDEPERLGFSYLLTSFVEGYVPAPWTADGQEFVRLLRGERRRFLEDLVRIEELDWQPHGLGGLLSDGDLVAHQRNRVTEWDALVHRVALRPDPLIEEVLRYLSDEVRPWGHLVVAHGDYRPGNIIYAPESRSVKAVIDWDGVHLGDYHENLGQLVTWAYRDREGLACGLFEDSELLELYEETSGRPLDRRGVHYYDMVMTFRRYLGFAVLAHAWVGGGGDLRMARAWLALENDRRHLGWLLDVAP